MIKYLYAADGSLLRQIEIRDSTEIKIRDYIGPVEFLNSGIDQIRHANGYVFVDKGLAQEHLFLTGIQPSQVHESISTVSERVVPDGVVAEYRSEECITMTKGFEVALGADFLATIDTFPVLGLKYRYFLRDHLGSVRVEFENDNGSALLKSQNSYYPFGCRHGGSWNQDTRNNHLYTGQERQGSFDLEYLRYKFRFGDPLVMGRFQSPDPLSDKFSHVNPFNHSENSPVANIDLHGLQKVDFHIAKRLKQHTTPSKQAENDWMGPVIGYTDEDRTKLIPE